jgi:hypothetical protein
MVVDPYLNKVLQTLGAKIGDVPEIEIHRYYTHCTAACFTAVHRSCHSPSARCVQMHMPDA